MPGGFGRPSNPVPHELRKSAMPPYVIEPPDIIAIDALNLVPKPPYLIRPLDTLGINASGVVPNQPIQGNYSVNPDGTVNLGPVYGTVLDVAGLSLEGAAKVITAHLKNLGFANPVVSVTLNTTRDIPQIRGDHLVQQDGTVSLGPYGAVFIAGLTVKEAREAIEMHLAQFLLKPQVSVVVTGFNSKVFYVVTDGAGNGRTVARLPLTGNETVLDVLAQVGGIPPQGSNKIWIARPAPDDMGCDQILPVDVKGITKRALTATNYQMLPGDRLYINAQCLVTFQNTLTKLFTPLETISGAALLGVSASQALRNPAGFVGTGFGGF
jgi:protein involved in polysaccharide export with SLBB domain